MTKRPLTGLGFALAAAAVVVLAAPDLQAYPDAKVETQTRPDFGLLLNPPTKRRKPHRPRYRDRPDYRGHHYGPDYRPWDGPLRDVAFVDCGQARGPNDVNRALDSLAPGGTLILRAGGAPCLDSVRISKPVTIQADGGRPWRGRRLGEFRGEWTSLPATLKARAGQVCIDIAPIATGEVVLRNMVIEATEGGDQPCIYSEGANLRLESTVIRYAGDGSAIYVDGGSFEAYEDSLIDANTYDRAVYAEDAVVKLRDFTITGTPAIGLDITPSGAQDSELEEVNFFTKPGSPVFGTPSVGINVSPSRTVGRLNIHRAKICGFGVGVWTAGPNVVNISDTHICRAGKGIGAYGGELKVESSAIGANIIGIQIGAAYPVSINDTDFYGAKEYDVFLEPGARPPLNGGGYNRFYSYPNRYCRAIELDRNHGAWRDYERSRRRNGRRTYMPGWRNNTGECRDPGSLDPRYLEFEERIGYDDPRAFYAMDSWPQDLWGSDHLDWGHDGRRSDQGAPPK